MKGMGGKRAVVVATVILLATGVCRAQNFGPVGDLLPIEWTVEQASSGRSTITGYIDNRHVFAAKGIRLLVEALDSSGQRVGQTIGYVSHDIPPGGRAYFEIPAPAAAATYRVALLAFDWSIQAP